MRLFLLLLLGTLLPAAVSIDGPTTARGIVGCPFVCMISARGAAPLVYGTSALPAGLVLDAATGRISGTPTTAVDAANVTISATGGSTSASMTLAITITAAGATGFPANAAAITVTAGSACSFQATASTTGGTFAALNLPSGLTISDAGLISGAPATSGIFNIDLSSDTGVTATCMAIIVRPAQTGAPAVQMLVQPLATAGSPFGCWIDTTGADAFSCSNLPAWLQLDGSTGSIVGTPAATDLTANLQLTISAGPLSTSTVMAIPVAIPASADLVPNAPTLVEGTVDSAIGWKVRTGTPTTLSAVNLPSGLVLDAASGLLSGIPAVAGICNVVVTSTPTDVTQAVSTTYGMRIRPATAGAPTIGDLLPPLLSIGAPAAITVPSIGATVNRYTISGDAAFTIDAAGIISGTPTVAGMPALRITAINDAGSTVSTLMLQISSRIVAAPQPTSPAIFRTTAGSAFAAALLADASVSTWSISGLPSQLDGWPFTGLITGSVATAGISNIAICPFDADGGNPTHSVLVADAATIGAPVISGAGPWYIGTGQPVRIALQADVAATWGVAGLPTGLVWNGGGAITGLATSAATANLTLTAQAGSSSARTSGLLIIEATPAGAPIFNDPGVLSAALNVPFSATLSASGSPFEYAIANGPGWLLIDGPTGVLSGTPLIDGTYVLSVAARNAAGTSRTTVVLRAGTSSPGGGGTITDPGVSGVSGGGCGAGGAGAAGLVLLALLASLRRRQPPI